MAIFKTTRMDAQGRVLIPAHIRNELNLAAEQAFTVCIENGAVQIRPEEARCIVCGESVSGRLHSEVTIGDSKKHFCRDCALAVAVAPLVEADAG